MSEINWQSAESAADAMGRMLFLVFEACQRAGFTEEQSMTVALNYQRILYGPQQASAPAINFDALISRGAIS